MSIQFDCIFFLYLYDTLPKKGINNESKSLAYWYNIDYCKTICSHPDKDTFDWKHYLESNQDLLQLGINNEKKCLIHWYTIGKKENRQINKKINKKILTIDLTSGGKNYEKNIDNKLNSQKILYTVKNLKINLEKETNHISNKQQKLELKETINQSKEYRPMQDIKSDIIKSDSIKFRDNQEKKIPLFEGIKHLPLLEEDTNIYNKITNMISLKNNIVSITNIRLNTDTDTDTDTDYSMYNNQIENSEIYFEPLEYRPDKILINILTRTSNRLNHFTECRNSVLKQTYKNIRHLVSIDDELTYDYVKKNGVPDSNIIKHIRTARLSGSHMPYNLYMNGLLEMVNTGWILFLDDDDILSDINSISTIVNNLPEIPSIMIFKTRYGDKVKPELYFKKKIEKGDITSNCFIFHSSLKNKSFWNDRKASDFFFLNKLSEGSKIFWLDKVLTQVNNISLNGFGNRTDKIINENKKNNFILENIFLSNRKYYLRKNTHKKCNLNHYFDHIYILNLERRFDKYVKTVNRLRNNDITYFERFLGTDGRLLINKARYHDHTLKLIDNSNYKKNFIPSSGSYSILTSMENIILDAKKKKYKRICVFQDDIIFHKEFKKRISNYHEILLSNWTLLYFGASQHNWTKISFNDKYYHPHNTDGAFAIGINSIIFDKLLTEIKIADLPFDSGPLTNIQNLFNNTCYVLWPNLIIADVTDSDCRMSRNQDILSDKFKWIQQDYDFDFFSKKDLIIHSIHNNIFTQKDLRMKKKDLVSVIIPCYNSQKYIEFSISSICNQTYKNLEIIVIDDDSTDCSSNIIRKLSKIDKRIKYIKNNHNLGTYVSKNIGIQKSSGEYILFHDSDAYSCINRIEYQVTFLLNNKHFSGCFASFFSKSKLKLSYAKASLCIRRDVINKIGYFDSVRVGADTEFRKRILISNMRLYWINKYLYSCLDKLMESNNVGADYTLTNCLHLGKNSDIRKIYKYSCEIYLDNLKKKNTISKEDLYHSFPLKKRLFPIHYNYSKQKNLLEVL